MVQVDWIERKLIQFEEDRCWNEWTDEKERQLLFLRELYKSGDFAYRTAENIMHHLALVFRQT